LEKNYYYLYLYVFLIICLRKLEVPWYWWQLPLLGRFKLLFLIFDYLFFKDLNVIVVGWHVPRRNLNAKQKQLVATIALGS
jgi:hypothetical protein